MERLDEAISAATLELFSDLPAEQARAVASHVDGGKKLRAVITLAACEALGGDVERALPAAAAVECIHAASLMHDDVVDGDRVRRGRPARWVVEGARRALLAADVMFATVLARSAELGRAHMVVLARAVARVAAGAYAEPLDVRDLAGCDAAAAYERTIRLKTGALFSAAAELGALAARAKPASRRALASFGEHVGCAYQIADDFDDVVTSGATTAQAIALRAFLAARFGAEGGDLARAMAAEIDRRLELGCAALAPALAAPSAAPLGRLAYAIVRPAAARARRDRHAGAVMRVAP